MVKIVVLNDNRVANPMCKSEHGLSLYLEVDGRKVLMDVGQSELYKENARNLGVNLDEVDTIILSHGHYDHARGLKYANAGTRLICHPDCCMYRYSTRTEQYGGIGYTEEELAEKFSLTMSREPYQISEDVTFLGEIPRKLDFEDVGKPMELEDGSPDTVPDDSSIVIDSKNGLIVISGCAHSGICNTVEYAKQVTGKSKVSTIIGGFHLKNVDDNTKKTIDYFRNSGANRIILAHCTSDEVCNEFRNALSNTISVGVMGVGQVIELDKTITKEEDIR